MSLSPKDMDFIEARHVAAREIALALGVPPMLLGIPGDNTYSNLAEAQRIFWRQTVLPLVTRTATALTNWLAPTYDSNLRLVSDLDAIEALSPERETLWARLEKTSFLTPDEKRAAIGYGPTPAGSRNKFHSPTLTDKFSPTQPRIPAGRPGGGQWTDGDDGGGGVINDVTDVIATVLDQIDIEDIDLGPIDGDIANPRNTIFDDTEPRQPSDLAIWYIQSTADAARQVRIIRPQTFCGSTRPRDKPSCRPGARKNSIRHGVHHRAHLRAMTSKVTFAIRTQSHDQPTNASPRSPAMLFQARIRRGA